MTTSSIDIPQTPLRNDYQSRAEQVAARVAQQWHESGDDDPKALSDAVYQALVEEANLELRQVLAHVQGQLQLAQMRVARGKPALDGARIGEMLDGLDRATLLIDTFLDRASATKLIIRLDRQPFDLAEALVGYVHLHGMEGRVRLSSLPSPVDGDREKLVHAIGHLVTRFYFASRQHEDTIVSIAPAGDRLEGFVGLCPSHLQPEELMDEIRLPLRIEDVGIDVAYTRAVLERHGGSLFVATAEDASVGFGFHLPLLQEVSL